ncbi:hypothetical protein CCP3SC1_390014 [Gammaproteobacteria bacterium]
MHRETYSPQDLFNEVKTGLNLKGSVLEHFPISLAYTQSNSPLGVQAFCPLAVPDAPT